MEKRPSLLLLLLLVVGAALVTANRPGAPAAAARRPAQIPAARTVRALEEPSIVWKYQCGAAPEPLKPLCTALYDPRERRQVTDWKRAPWVLKNRAALRTAIVTVADPDETGELIRFDRAIDTIQNAASALDYSLQSHWIPWQPSHGPAEETGADGRRNGNTGGDEPGALLFRERKGGGFLIVFLVGESPVLGIRRVQFLNAMYYIDALSDARTDRTVYLAGPNFSGSFASLREAIDDAGALSPGRIDKFQVISPSATVRDAAILFLQGAGSNGGPKIEYHSAVHADDVARTRLRDYVRSRWGLNWNEHAVIAESESVFGRSAAGDERRRIQFPRGISRLRNAYPEASARNLFAPEIAGSPQPEHLAVPLRGRGPGAESVPSFAAEQVPVAQEAVLLSIAETLRREEIRFAQIVATDVIDTIFVAGFLRKANPDVRIYVWNADLLLTRAAERLPLEGSLAVTSFPLIMDNQIWWRDPASARDLRPMASRYEAGLFIALRELLNQPGVASESTKTFGFVPRLWLTAIGSNGYWPIALLDKGDETGGDNLLLHRAGMSVGGPAADQRWPHAGQPARSWFYVFCTILVVAALLSAMAIAAQPEWVRTLHGNRMLAQWSARPEDTGALGRAYFASVLCLVPGMMLFALAAPVWMLRRHGAGGDWTASYAYASAAVVAMLLAGAAAPYLAIARRRLSGRIPRDPAEPGGYGWIGLVALAGTVAFVTVWLLEMQPSETLQGFFFIYRSLDLLNGVCPAMPFLLLGAGFLTLAALHQRRFALFLEMPAELPNLEGDPLLKGIEEGVSRVREPLGHALVSSQPLGLALALAGMAGMVFLPWSGQQSLEDRKFDVMYLGALVLFYVMVVLTWARFLVVWIRLKQVLDRLACHPLSAAIAALPADYAASSILEGRGRFGLQQLLSGSLNVLRAFSRSLVDPWSRRLVETKTEALKAAGHPFLDLRQPTPEPGQLAGVWKLLSGAGSEIADCLRRYWSRGCAAAPQIVDQGRKPDGGQCPEAVRLGEQFIALQYVYFVGNAMHQLRNLLVYVTTGFFLGMVSTLVYPFRSQNAMIWAGTINFLVLGIPVVIAIVQMETHALLRTVSEDAGRRRLVAPVLRVGLYGALPLLGIASSHFPAVGRYLAWLLQPAMQAVR